MRTRRTFFTGLIIALFIVQTATAQTNFSWVGGTGSNWSETANWSPAGVPGISDTALITLEGDYSVILDVDASVSKIVLGGVSGMQTLSLSGRTLTVSEVVEVGTNGVLSVTSSTIAGDGSIVNSGTLASSSGILNTGFENYGLSTFTGTNELNDTIITHANSTLNIVSSGPIDFRADKGFENNGLMQCLTYNYWGGGAMEVTNGSLVNNAGGVLNILAPGTLSSSSSPFNLVLQLENNGEVFVDHWTVLEKEAAIHANSGILSLQNHIMTITQPGTISAFSNTGTISVDNTSTLNINGGTFDFISGLLDVQGLFSISNATVNLLPEYVNSISLSLTGSTLNCSSAFTNQHKLAVINTTVNGSDFFTNQDTLSTRGAVFNMDIINEGLAIFEGNTEINDTLITQPNSTLRISSYSNLPIQFTSASGFTNYGLFEGLIYNYWAGGHITITEGVFLNDAQGIMAISAPGTLSSAASPLYLYLELDNQGEITIDYNTILQQTSAHHTNTGTIEISNHYLSIAQDGTSPAFINEGDLVVDSNSSFTVNGGSFDYNSGLIDSGGSLSFVNATVNLVPAYFNTSSLTFNNSVVNCSAAFTNQSDLAIINSTINGDHLFTNQDTMDVSGIEFNMDFDNQAMAILANQILINDTLITNPNSSLEITAGSYMDFTSVKGFTNKGLLECITRNYWGGGTMEVTNGSLINNEGGILNILVQGSLSSASTPITLDFHLDNRGEAWVDHEAILSKASVIHENSGVLKVTNHTLTINQAGTTFRNQSTGSIYGNGTLSFTGAVFVNSGSINPGQSAGLLTVNGDVAQDATSVLSIEIGGLAVGTSYDKLDVSGSYAIDGQLHVALIDGFTPNLGDVFDIVGFTSATGDYDSIIAPYTGTGFIFDVEQNPANLNLITVAHANSPPFVDSPVADLALDEDFESLRVANLDTVFNDPDISLGDKLTYSYAVLDNIVEASINNNELSLNSIPDLNGVSSIVITASDAGQEIASDTVIIQVSAVNDAPGAFSLISPADGITIPDTTEMKFKWQSASDVDGDPLEYTLNISSASWDTVIADLTDTVFTYTNASALAPNETYQWTVSASDGQAATICVEDFSFTTHDATFIHPLGANSNFQLKQNYPNPFSSATYIDFSIPASEYVTIKIYNLNGGLIHTLVAGELPPGSYSYRLELDNAASGTYFYRLQLGSTSMIKKMTKIE